MLTIKEILNCQKTCVREPREGIHITYWWILKGCHPLAYRKVTSLLSSCLMLASLFTSHKKMEKFNKKSETHSKGKYVVLLTEGQGPHHQGS